MSDKQELSRSEVARQRRASRVVKELAQTSKRASKPVVRVARAAPRVAPRAAVNRKRVASKRRFNIALGLPEIHLLEAGPYCPTSSCQLAAYLYFDCGISQRYGFSRAHPSFFRVPSVTVLGNNRLSREEIEAVLGVVGQSIFTVQPEEVAVRLRMNYPELLSAQVNVYLPNHVYVTVTERQPVVVWQQDRGYTWIDATGVAFRPRGMVAGLVPVIGLAVPPVGIPPLDNPLAPPPFMQKELVDAILALAPTVPADSTMVFDRSLGLGWTDSRGWKSFFGTSAQDMPLKVRVYQSLVNSLVKRGIIPSFISVMYPDAPFYRTAKVDLALPVNNGH